MKFSTEAIASTGIVSITLGGDIRGNGQIATIEVSSDGGQFPETEIEKTETGFIIKIVGTFELDDFVTALHETWLKTGNARKGV